MSDETVCVHVRYAGTEHVRNTFRIRPYKICPDPTRPDPNNYLPSPSILTLGATRGFAAMEGRR